MRERTRRIVAGMILIGVACGVLFVQTASYDIPPPPPPGDAASISRQSAAAMLETLQVKGRSARTHYDRAQFGDGWQRQGICDTRNIILARDLVDEVVNSDCRVLSGELHDPYSGQTISFVRGASTSDAVQIDHVVALGDAWQKGASQWPRARRIAFANDPLELLAVDGQANQRKGAGDAATWLPPNKSFRCQYIARQIAIKARYQLWVTAAEKQAMQRVLGKCPGQTAPMAES